MTFDVHFLSQRGCRMYFCQTRKAEFFSHLGLSDALLLNREGENMLTKTEKHGLVISIAKVEGKQSGFISSFMSFMLFVLRLG